MKISDLIGVVLILLGTLMTVLNLRMARQPVAELQSFTVRELPSPRSELTGPRSELPSPRSDITPRGAGNNI